MAELIIAAAVVFIIYKLYKSFNKSINERSRAEDSVLSLTQLIQKQPDNPRYYFLRGACYHRLHNYRLAIDDYTKAYDLNPTNESFKFLSNDGTFNNYAILKNRGAAKHDIGDKYGSEQDKELSEKSQFASTPQKPKVEVSTTTYSSPPKKVPLSESNLTPEEMKKLTRRILDAALRKKAGKYNLVTTFFADLGEYMNFIIDGHRKVVINDQNTCVASLEKKPDKKLLYTLAYIPENIFITETIPNFIASPQNIVKFNRACLVFASRLETCIELDDEKAVSDKPSAFADLDLNK